MARSADRAARVAAGSPPPHVPQRRPRLSAGARHVHIGVELATAQAKLSVADAAYPRPICSSRRAGPLRRVPARAADDCEQEDDLHQPRGRDTPPLLLAAARRLEPWSAVIAARTYLEAIASAMFAGRLGAAGPDQREVAAGRAHGASRRVQAPGPADMLLDALVTRHRGVRDFRRAALAAPAHIRRTRQAVEDRRWLSLASTSRRIYGTTSSGTCSRPRRAPRARHQHAQPVRTRSTISPRSTSIPGLRHRRGAGRRGQHRSRRRPDSRRSSTRRAC